VAQVAQKQGEVAHGFFQLLLAHIVSCATCATCATTFEKKKLFFIF